MSLGALVTIAMGIITVAGLTVALTSPNTVAVVNTAGSTFVNALGTAMGRR